MTDRRISKLSQHEREQLLKLARQSVEAAAAGLPPPPVALDDLPPGLREPAACFVTLYVGRDLRGCTGTLAARCPLAEEVVQTAMQTALYDPRFSPVTPHEIRSIDIEISVLTAPQRLDIQSPDDIPRLIRPGIDGVTLSKGIYRATFLPQVWDKVPHPVEFLNMLSQKMGLSSHAWRAPGMQVEVYQVEEFAEKDLME
jgi:AmmeMemoRadiSam system protein A